MSVIEITEDEAEAYGMNEPAYKMLVTGNCGKIHRSFEEWQQCRLCDLPPPTPRFEWFGVAPYWS